MAHDFGRVFGGLEGTVRDYFSADTAMTLGGVASGIAIGELAGAIVSQQWRLSPGVDLGAKVGVKSAGAIATRHFTRGKGNLDTVGVALAAGLGTSAVVDGIRFVYPRITGHTLPDGYNWLTGFVDTGPRALPAVENNNEKVDRFLRRVPVRLTEEEPLEMPGYVI